MGKVQDDFAIDDRRLRLTDGTCGHCNFGVQFAPDSSDLSLSFYHDTYDEEKEVTERATHELLVGICPRPSCRKPTVVYRMISALLEYRNEYSIHFEVIYPRAAGGRSQLPDQVPEELRKLFAEAASIEILSPTGTALLCGRILEGALRSELKQPRAQLANLIERFTKERNLPSDLGEVMELVRGFRNIAGHAGQSDSGNLINVDHREASFLLGAVEEVLDFLYVRPRRRAEMMESLRLKQSGKVTGLPPTIKLGPIPEPPQSEKSDYSQFEVHDSDTDDLPF
jgi:hypothetical protein